MSSTANRRALGAGCVVVLLALVGSEAPAGGINKKKKDHAARYLKQFNARFNEWDTNDDKVLDKYELARVFRGPKAKPLDQLAKQVEVPVNPPPAPKPAVKKKAPLKASAVLLTCLPRGGLPVQLAAAQLLTENPARRGFDPATETDPAAPIPMSQKVKIHPNYAALPDYQFLVVVGKNNDFKVTKAEFDGWAKQYARLLDRQDDVEAEIRQGEAKVKKANNKKARQQAQKELQRHRQELQQVNAQLNAVPPAIRKELRIKH